MSTITKTLSTELASVLLKNKKEQLSKLKSKMEDCLREIIEKRIPKEVLEVANKHPEFFKKEGYFTLSGNGFDYKRIVISGKIVCSNSNLFLSKEESNKFKPFCDKFYETEKEIKDIRQELESVIFCLRTYKKVLEQFPELEKHLPTKTSTYLSLDISHLKEKLK